VPDVRSQVRGRANQSGGGIKRTPGRIIVLPCRRAVAGAACRKRASMREGRGSNRPSAVVGVAGSWLWGSSVAHSSIAPFVMGDQVRWERLR
jgi:hypothetical protein